jgi:hypothetical protein
MDDLATLFAQAVEDVQPTDRRAELREAVTVAGRRRFRRTVTGGLLAAAVVVTGVAVTMHRTDQHHETGPVGPPRAIDRSRDNRPAYALYYLGQTPQGARLYREFRPGPGPEMTPASAISLMQEQPEDPDYRTLWPAGTFSGAQVAGGVIDVEVADPGAVGHRLDGMTAATAELSVDQVIYTVQAAVQNELPVQFTHDGSPIAEVLGVPTSEPLARGEAVEVLSLASISNPSERRVVEDYFSADGQASSFEGNVPWQLKAPDGSVVRSGTAQSFGWQDRLYPWATGRIDVSDLAPGEYTFTVMTADPSGGAEGAGPMVDTRTIIIS